MNAHSGFIAEKQDIAKYAPAIHPVISSHFQTNIAYVRSGLQTRRWL